MENIDVSKYIHSFVHRAVASRDYGGLIAILSSLPKPQDPCEIQTEVVSLVEEATSDAISVVIDRRVVPRHETPLYLAVKLCDSTAVEMLMIARADSTAVEMLMTALKLYLPDFPKVNGENGFIDQQHDHIEVHAVDLSQSNKKLRKRGGWEVGEEKRQNKRSKFNMHLQEVLFKVSNFLGESNQIKPGRHSVDNEHIRKPRASVSSKTHHESEYKKGLRPVLWLSPNFPLQTEELLPLLDILANKVKSICRLRELLTTRSR